MAATDPTFRVPGSSADEVASRGVPRHPPASLGSVDHDASGSETSESRSRSRPETERRTLRYQLTFALVVAAAAVVVLSPVLFRTGWPLNQGSTGPLLLVQMYAAHFRHLDFLPVWSSSDGVGLGSPVLLYYHHLFFAVAGLLVVLGVGLKPAVVGALALFLVVGAYGMRAAVGVVTQRRLLGVVAAVGYLLTNYGFTDWLDPRGDLAEFSALMLIPWVLWWCLTLIVRRRVSWAIIPVMVLLVNAHTAIALLTGFVLAVALLTLVAFGGWAALRTMWGRLAIIVGSVAVLVGPELVVDARMGQFYDPQTKNPEFGYKITQQFASFWSYFYDGSHRWFHPEVRDFVQIDFAIWIPVAFGLVVLVVLLARSDRARLRAALGDDGPLLTFLVISLAVYLFLQLRASLFIYDLLSPLQVINFPWRMLGYITALGVVLVAFLADRLFDRFPNPAVEYSCVGVWLVALLLASPVAKPVATDYAYLAKPGDFPALSIFTAPRSIDYRTFNGFFLGTGTGALYGVFMPKVLQSNGQEVYNDEILYDQLHRHQAGAQSLSATPCRRHWSRQRPLRNASAEVLGGV